MIDDMSIIQRGFNRPPLQRRPILTQLRSKGSGALVFTGSDVSVRDDSIKKSINGF